PTHEPERRRRLSPAAARAAPPASSRQFPQPGPSPRSPSSELSPQSNERKNACNDCVLRIGTAGFDASLKDFLRSPARSAGDRRAGQAERGRAAASAQPATP